MRSGRGLLAAAAAVILVGAAVGLLSAARGSAGSTLGQGASGWRGMFRVLESSGVEVHQLDRPVSERDSYFASLGSTPSGPGRARGTVVVSFPWQRAGSLADEEALVQHLRAVGRLVVAYSGRQLAESEQELLHRMGLRHRRLASSTSLLPWVWWREQRPDTHRATELLPLEHAITSDRLHWIATSPAEESAAVYARAEGGEPVVSSFPHLGGEVWLLPTSLFSNAYLSSPGNASLLLALGAQLSQPLLFDELHHGLVAAESATAAGSRRALDWMLGQLGLIYLLALLAFAWRFGPAWPARAAAFDSHRDFLVGLGGVHHRLGHEQEAIRSLVERVSAYAPSRLPIQDLPRLQQRAEGRSLLWLARRLSWTHRPTTGGRRA